MQVEAEKLGDELVGLVPELRAAQFMPITLPPGAKFDTRGRRGQGQVGVDTKGGRGEVSWLDSAGGRIRVDAGNDGWVSVNPMRHNELLRAIGSPPRLHEVEEGEMDPAQWLADYQERLERVAYSARWASASLAEVGASATSPRGEVTVTVNAGGVLGDVSLTPAARKLDVDTLAMLIVSTAREAQRLASARMTEVMADLPR